MSSERPERVAATGLRGVGLVALPRVTDEWRRLGLGFDGFVYFVYDMRAPLGAEIGAHVHGRRRGIAYEAALAEVKQLVEEARGTEELPAGAQMCDSETVLKLVRHLDTDACERLRREFGKAPPAGHVRMVMLEERGVRLELVPVPLPN